MRRQLAELAQRVGVSIQPQIDVEDIEAALELAARGLGDTIVSRGILLAMGRRVSKRLGWVPFDEPFYDDLRVRLARQRAAVARLARVPRAGARAAGRAGAAAAHRAAAPARAGLAAPRRGAVAAQAAQQGVAGLRVAGRGRCPAPGRARG